MEAGQAPEGWAQDMKTSCIITQDRDEIAPMVLAEAMELRRLAAGRDIRRQGRRIALAGGEDRADDHADIIAQMLDMSAAACDQHIVPVDSDRQRLGAGNRVPDRWRDGAAFRRRREYGDKSLHQMILIGQKGRT
jgi:hypothetical protein